MIEVDGAVLIDVTRAPAWLRWVSVNEMPNFTGVSAMPRFRIGERRVERRDLLAPGAIVSMNVRTAR